MPATLKEANRKDSSPVTYKYEGKARLMNVDLRCRQTISFKFLAPPYR
jgi:hypothetical protein